MYDRTSIGGSAHDPKQSSVKEVVKIKRCRPSYYKIAGSSKWCSMVSASNERMPPASRYKKNQSKGRARVSIQLARMVHTDGANTSSHKTDAELFMLIVAVSFLDEYIMSLCWPLYINIS